jgi:trehalose transport system permease protein
MRPRRIVRVGLLALAIAASVLFMIGPLYIMTVMSVGDPQETFATQTPAYVLSGIDRPDPPGEYADTVWEHLPRWWSRVLTERVAGGIGVRSELVQLVSKSLRVSVLTTVVALAIAVPGGYAISRIDARLKYGLIVFIFMSSMYPEVGLALPLSVTLLRLDRLLPGVPLYDSVLGLELVAAHLLLAVPLATWIMVNQFETVPITLEEQASVDGASRLATLWRVLIPLVKPGIAVAAIFAWIASWEDVPYALFLSLANRTLPTETVNVIRFSPPPVIATYAVLVTVPVLVLTYSAGKRMQSGLLAGAVKE